MNRTSPSVTTSLIIINVVVFLVGQVARQPALLGISVPGADVTEPTLQVMGAYSWFTCFMEGEIWRLVTYQFLHEIDFRHILLNMVALFFFGPAVERIMGPRKFLLYYLGCGVAGALSSSVLADIGLYSSLDDQSVYSVNQRLYSLNALVQQFTDYSGTVEPWQMVPMIGASAAVYGVMVSVAFMFPHVRITLLFPPVSMTMRTFALVIIGIIIGKAAVSVLLNLNNAGGEAGHLGGIIMGAIIMLIWKWRNENYY